MFINRHKSDVRNPGTPHSALNTRTNQVNAQSFQICSIANITHAAHLPIQGTLQYRNDRL